MSAATQPTPEIAAELPQELAELGRQILRLDQQETTGLRTAYRQVVSSVMERRKILLQIQEVLAQLRLEVKYLAFDLEATRRERDLLRSQLPGE
jgi:hypothetical protein